MAKQTHEHTIRLLFLFFIFLFFLVVILLFHLVFDFYIYLYFIIYLLSSLIFYLFFFFFSGSPPLSPSLTWNWTKGWTLFNLLWMSVLKFHIIFYIKKEKKKKKTFFIFIFHFHFSINTTPPFSPPTFPSPIHPNAQNNFANCS